MTQTNDGKSDSSVSYTPVAPLNKEEAVAKLAIHIQAYHNSSPYPDIIKCGCILALLNNQREEAYKKGYKDGVSKARGLPTDHVLFRSGNHLDQMASFAYGDTLNNKEETDE